MEDSYAVIFDLDGVLVDSETHWKKVGSSFLRELVPEWDEELQRSIHGTSIFSVYDLLVSRHALSISREKFLLYYQKVASHLYRELANLLPGARELVLEFATRDIPLGVASSSATEWIALSLERFGLRQHFRAIVGADLVDGAGKPSPRVYLRAAELLSQNPKRCVAIEDSPNGIQSAQAAGMYCFGLLNGLNSRLDLAQADRVIEDLNELQRVNLQEILPSLG